MVQARESLVHGRHAYRADAIAERRADRLFRAALAEDNRKFREENRRAASERARGAKQMKTG
jgi:hypothetical protein